MNGFIKVLWIEDDPEVTSAYPEEAYDYGIELIPYPCWDAAKDELNKNYDSWEAIVLDARCKVHASDLDSAPRFLSNVLSELNGLTSKHERVIPWYVLSGGDVEEIGQSITEQRLKWDSDWDIISKQPYYNKTTKHRLKLFERIKLQCTERPQAIQVKSVLYKEVFEALRECNLDLDAENCLTDLLCPIVFRDVDAKDYNNRMLKCRMLLEYLFKDMIDREILPDTFREINEDSGKDKVNLTLCSKLLAGVRLPDWAHVSSHNPIVPKLMADNIWTMVNAIGSNQHSNSKYSTDRVSMNQYRSEVGQTAFLLQSFALQCCDIVLWYNRYIKNHSVVDNRKNWNYV